MTAQTRSMNELGERYVRLVLAMGQHDPDYVDAYYGPPAWREESKGRSLAETAGILGRSESAAAALLHRALRSLRGRLTGKKS